MKVKKIGIAIAIALVYLAVSAFVRHKYIFYPNVEGNASQYSVEQTPVLPSSPLSGKTFFFLGSSVTLGAASKNESFVDFIRKRNSCICVKNAVSGTTLMDIGKESYIKRLSQFDTHIKVDAFVCQLSTNDIRFNGTDKFGSVSASTDRKDFDVNTTIGAVEYIISYAKETWHCPVIFYTNSNFGDKKYELLINELYKVKSKSNIEIIDLYNDKKLNSISSDSLKLYMAPDLVHPYKAGYKLWWTPVFEKCLYEIVCVNKH